MCYRLCVCASGSLITVILNCFTWIKVSCLHFGQNSGKFLSSVSFRIFNLVLFPQTGHNTQFSLSIFYYSPLILLLLTIRGSELLQFLRLRTLHPVANELRGNGVRRTERHIRPIVEIGDIILYAIQMAVIGV